MPNFKPELSVIIVNYRSEQYLRNCLASLFNCLKDVAWEAIIVNNDKKEKLQELPAGENRVTIINQEKNNGFGAGANRGASAASGDIMLFLNPDTVILSTEIKTAIDRLRNSSHAAIIGLGLVAQDGKIQPWCAGKEHTLWRTIKNNVGIIESRQIWQSGRETRADWVSGGAMLVKKKTFDELGGFDERYFMYFEDNDICRRARMAGYGVLFFPDIKVMHYAGKSATNKIQLKLRYYLSALRYFWKFRN